MGRRGPAPVPTKLRLLHGARESDVNMDEPIPRSGDIERPYDMSVDVSAIFWRTVRELEHMGLAAPSDVDSIAAYAEAVDKHRKAAALLKVSPILVKGIHGNLVRNPALIVQRDTALLIRAFAQEFGLTPSARTRIETVKAQAATDDNPFAGHG